MNQTTHKMTDPIQIKHYKEDITSFNQLYEHAHEPDRTHTRPHDVMAGLVRGVYAVIVHIDGKREILKLIY